MKRVSHVLEYAAVLLMDRIVSAPPLDTALGWGERLGSFIGWLLKGRRRLILENLSHAFPESTDAERQKIADGVFRNIGRAGIEFIRGPEIIRQKDRIVIHGGDGVFEAYKRGKGVVYVAAHFCAWELLGLLISSHFGRMSAIVRPMRNPLVEKWVQSKRVAGEMPFILHRDAVRGSLKKLKKGDAVGILPDQNLYKGGIFVDFFGRPAATTTLPALMAIRAEAALFNSYCLRQGREYHFHFEPIHFPEVADEDKKIEAYTKVVAKTQEALIRRHPDLWFWLHNRWKRAHEAGAEAAA